MLTLSRGTRMRNIIFYETENDKIPIRDFIDSLDISIVKLIISGGRNEARQLY